MFVDTKRNLCLKTSFFALNMRNTDYNIEPFFMEIFKPLQMKMQPTVDCIVLIYLILLK